MALAGNLAAAGRRLIARFSRALAEERMHRAARLKRFGSLCLRMEIGLKPSLCMADYDKTADTKSELVKAISAMAPKPETERRA
jgi:hypothetical protein